MNPIRFFNENWSTLFSDPTNDPVQDAQRALRSPYDIGTAKPQRLTDRWIIIKNGFRPLTNAPIRDDRVMVDTTGRSAFQVFYDLLSQWHREPAMIIHLKGKAGMNASNLMLTYDRRVTRICTPKGIISFDFTKPHGELSSKTEIFIKSKASK